MSLQMLLKRWGLARLVRLLVVASLPPTWLEIALLHFRGSFHNKLMWAPVAGLLPILASGAASAATRDEERSRRRFRPYASLLAAVGIAGTLAHLRGVGRQMGGFRNWRVNAITGPPVPAPLQVAVFGLLGMMASAPAGPRETARLVRAVHAVAFLSYPLVAVEAGYSHWAGGFFHKAMYLPVTTGPHLSLLHLARFLGVRTGRTADGWLSGSAAVAGLGGTLFHVRNVSRQRGTDDAGWPTWQRLFYGAPVMAPLQLTALGLLGMLAALFEEGE